MPIRDLIHGRLQCCSPEMSVKEASQLMKKHNIGSIVVVNDGKPIGMVTDRDVVVRCVSQGMDPVQTPIQKIMSRAVRTVQEDTGVQDAIRMMREAKIRRIPVVDQKGRAISVLSIDDLYGLLAKEMNDLSRVVSLSGRPSLRAAA